MAKQVINVGTVANDGTGDTIRSAMTKANANFTELYSKTLDPLTSATLTATHLIGYNSITGAVRPFSNMTVDSVTGQLRISGGVTDTTTPTLSLIDSQNTAFSILEYSSNATTRPLIHLVKRRGDLATSPETPIAGDLLGSLIVWNASAANANIDTPNSKIDWIATTATDGEINSRLVISTKVNSTIREVLSSSETGQIRVSDAYTLPLSDGSADQVLTTNGSGVVSFTGPYISVDSLKTLVAASTDFADFQSRIAAL